MREAQAVKANEREAVTDDEKSCHRLLANLNGLWLCGTKETTITKPLRYDKEDRLDIRMVATFLWIDL